MLRYQSVLESGTIKAVIASLGHGISIDIDPKLSWDSTALRTLAEALKGAAAVLDHTVRAWLVFEAVTPETGLLPYATWTTALFT